MKMSTFKIQGSEDPLQSLPTPMGRESRPLLLFHEGPEIKESSYFIAY